MSAGRIKVGAVVIAQNEEETIERSIRSYYDQVDAIYVSTDPLRGWTGQPVTPDSTLDIVRRIDRDNKVTILERDFCRYDKPMQNEVYQRHTTAEELLKAHPDLDWIVEIDADEVFLNFPGFLATLSCLPKSTRAVYWMWVGLFRTMPNDDVLAIVDEAGKPALERFPIAHRPGARLHTGRYVDLYYPGVPKKLARLLWRLGYDARREYTGGQEPGEAVLHWSFAKSEAKIREKLSTYGHSQDFDADAFYQIWLSSVDNWPSMRDFHPMTAWLWPRLRRYSLAELQAVANPAVGAASSVGGADEKQPAVSR